jgi:hypothetical protein
MRANRHFGRSLIGRDGGTKIIDGVPHTSIDIIAKFNRFRECGGTPEVPEDNCLAARGASSADGCAAAA